MVDDPASKASELCFWYPLKQLTDSGKAEAPAEQIRKRLLAVLVTVRKFAEPAGFEAS